MLPFRLGTLCFKKILKLQVWITLLDRIEHLNNKILTSFFFNNVECNSILPVQSCNIIVIRSNPDTNSDNAMGPWVSGSNSDPVVRPVGQFSSNIYMNYFYFMINSDIFYYQLN